MQVPERLALIGGSILLASTLVFTLKSQASHILPQIHHSIASIGDSNDDLTAQYGSQFDKDYSQAKHKGWKTGYWGDSKYYIDDQENMHVGKGELDGKLVDVIGSDTANQVRSLTLESNNHAPSDSIQLFAWVSQAQTINGLDRLDTKDVHNMHGMFEGDKSVQDLDVKDWDTGNVNDTSFLFHNDNELRRVDISNWHVHNAIISSMFAEDNNVQDINLSNFDTSSGWNDGKFFLRNYSLRSVTLGDKSSLINSGLLDGTWQNGDQTMSAIQLMNGENGNGNINSNDTHPGTWVKQ